MTPCEDIQTIHASQNDNEAREWEFELHNNGEVIDAGGITEQMVFKSYKGGTEQILPENGAVPVTAPFVGDIKYPDATRNDQEFLYRESPTEEDGNAKIKKLYGNTLVWNQQLQKEYNMTSNKGAEGYFRYNRCTPSYNSSTGVYTLTALENTGVSGFYFNKPSNGANLVENHKYLAVCTVRAPKAFRFSIGDGNSPSLISVPANTTQTVYTIFTVNANTREVIYNFHATGSTNNWDGTESVTITDVMLIDLTQLGLDVTYQQFVSLFSLPYYDYCQGAMLSFGGRNVKFNQLVQNGNFASTANWVVGGTSFTVSSNEATFVGNQYTSFSQPMPKSCIGHKVLAIATCKTGGSNSVFKIRKYTSSTTYTDSNESIPASYQTLAQRISLDSNLTGATVMFQNNDSVSATINVKNVMFFDLTEMFGAGNEPSVEGFKELFHNDYYEYTTGKYMNIGQPVSLKTTGKNLWKYTDSLYKRYCALNNQNGTITVSATGTDCYFGDVVAAGLNYSIEKGWLIDVSKINNLAIRTGNSLFWKNYITRYDANKVSLGFQAFTSDVFTADVSNCKYVSFRFGYANSVSGTDYVIKPQVEIGTQSTDFEPYAESVLPIPLNEFPDGMDGVDNANDERNETKYVKRVGKITLNGSEPWKEKDSSGNCWMDFNVTPLVADYKETMKATVDVATSRTTMTANSICGYNQLSSSANYLYFRTADSEQTAANVKAYLQAHPVTLVYELKTPLENYGVVDLGTLNWVVSNGVTPLRFEATMPSNYKKPATSAERNRLICSRYVPRSSVTASNNETGITNYQGLNVIFVRDLTYADVASFKQSLQGVYLLYEKENPQGFTTATLVTENGEVALANENGVLVGKCNSDISADAGFIEGKIKLADADGECYSNKLQLHVERKPS